MIIKISLCPTELEFNNGDRYHPQKLMDAMRTFLAKKYPRATVELQIGYRQGHKWAYANGNADWGKELVEEFFSKHGNDEELFIDEDNSYRQMLRRVAMRTIYLTEGDGYE